jgi:KDEL-tailed cysteine endopeptidase
MTNGFKYVIANGGITSFANYPYKGANGSCDKTKAAQKVATIASYKNVPADNTSQLYAAVAVQPVSVAVQANQPVWQSYTGGILSSGCGTALDHAVTAVGYNSASPPYWKVKNSWGTSWGEAGYIRIAIVSGQGVCGIQMDCSYPVA